MTDILKTTGLTRDEVTNQLNRLAMFPPTGKFSPDEMKLLRKMINRAIDTQTLWIGEGVVRLPLVHAEFKARTGVVLLRPGRPI